MRKIISVFLVIFLVMLSVVPTVCAISDVDSESSFFISIYNDIDHTYVLENKMITINKKATVSNTLELLKEKNVITGYTIDNNELTSIEYKNNDNTKTLSATTSEFFYTKLNGNKLALDGIEMDIENGDIVEWIYGNVTGEVYVPESISESEKIQSRPQTTLWTDELQNTMSSACEFLTLNQETSDNYIIALGCAGKGADVKMVNNLLSDIRQTQTYTTPNAISKNILALTFCGYDAAELVAQLNIFPEIEKYGIYAFIDALTAYDSKEYSVPNDKNNSRDKLISIILANQHESGGFGIEKNLDDNLSATCKAITALSPYIERENIKDAIDKAVQFIIKSQTNTGGFGIEGHETSDNMSEVIIALSSVGVDINDQRLINKKKNLLDMLLHFRNSDGGFSQTKGEVSTATSTELAVIALSAIKKNDNPYKITKLLSLPPKAKNIKTVNVIKNMSFSTGVFILLSVIIVIVVVITSIVKNNTKLGKK